MPLTAQDKSYTTKSKKAIGFYEQSEDYYIRRQYGQAVALLEKALEKDEDFAEAYLRLMRIYQTIDDRQKISLYANKIVSLQPDNPRFAEAPLQLAILAFQTGKYAYSREYLDKILSLNPLPKRIGEEAERLKVNVDFAEEAIKNPLPFNPQPLPATVNKLPLQYFPVLTADQQSIIFTGRKGTTPQYDEDIYICTKSPTGEWQAPKQISTNINSEFNEGTCTISADGRTLIFTSCLGRRGFGSCDLYISYKQGDEWSVPENLGNTVNSSSWESQPSLSADGKALYFVSDRPGGFGQRDIYVTHLSADNQWERPLNLGREVNTRYDEVSPFIHVNGQTLYFASTGYPGFGGFDLFFTEKENNSWKKPKNLGYPLNTFEDQVSLYMTADGEKGYYSYERGREGQNYTSTLSEFDVPEEIRVTNRSNFVKGVVRDAETRKELSAQVELYDLREQKREYAVQSDPATGEYMMVLTEGSEYALYVEKQGYLFESLAFNYSDTIQKNKQLDPVYIDVDLQPIKAGKETVLNNIFFDTDQYETKKKSKTELAKIVMFLQSNQQININIAGHTDNVGNKTYNKELSLKRAKAVRDYLIQAGIAEERVGYQGYGQDKPIALNDTEDNRQKNRRITFEIVE